MPQCLCCAENQPVTTEKVCPICGHLFKGLGWWGIDSHWKARHEDRIPYSEFWEGMCEGHRGTGDRDETPTENLAAKVRPSLPEATMDAMARRSSHVENVLTHSLIAKIAQVLWKRDPWFDLQVFKADVDDAGFDLVLGCQGVMRYIQIKQTYLQGKAVKYSMRLDFARMKDACAVVLVYDGATLEIDHCLFYGGAPGESMPDIEGNKVSLSPGRRTADGARKARENYRDVPRKCFEGPLTTADLVQRLFGF